MYKTIWAIKIDGTETVELTYYHFGRTPRFPSWYMEEGYWYEIEIIWHFKLIMSVKTFCKCLFHNYIIK